nr:uncharacterized protein LOC129257515 [Lytechinus pictus]
MDLSTDSKNVSVNSSTDHHSHDMEHSLSTVIIAAISLSIIIVVSVCANALATSTILRVRLLRENLHNHLIVNLNVISMLITVFSMPLALVSIFDDGKLLEHNTGLCLFNGFCSIAFPVASSFTVLWIAVDRYLTVVWSKRFPPSNARTIFMIVSTWVVSCIVAILPLLNVLSEYFYMHDTHHCSPVWEKCEFYFVIFFAVYGLSIPIMVVSYVFVVYHLCKKERKMQSHQSFRSRSRSRFSRSERSVKKTKRIKAERNTKEQSSSLVTDSSHKNSEPTKGKIHHDSGYASPPKNSLVGTDSPPGSAKILPGEAVNLEYGSLNKNNSASTDDGPDEKRLSVCVRHGSVRDMIKRLEKKKDKTRSKYDSLPKARRKLGVTPNDLRKAASANDIVEYHDPSFDNCTSGSEDNTVNIKYFGEECCHADLLNQGEVHCDDDSTPVVVECFVYEDPEPDHNPERTMLSEQVRECDYPIIPHIIIDHVTKEEPLPDSDDENSSETPNSSTYGSQNEESGATVLSDTVESGLLALPNSSCMNDEDGELSSCNERHGDDVRARSVPGLQFSVVIQRLATSDESPSNGEVRPKREGSIGSLSSMRSVTGTMKLKRGSTRRPSMRPTLTADKQVALMGGLLVLTAVICWTPYFVIHSCFFPMNIAPHWTSILTTWLAYLNAMFNPLIYSFTNRRIRAMVATFCGKRCRRMRALLCRKSQETTTIVPH